MTFDYVVLIHRIYSDGNVKKGGLDLIIDFLAAKDKRILLVEFPLDYKQSKQIRISMFRDNTQKVLEISRMPFYIPVVVWGLEFLLTLTAIFRYGATGTTVITSDPLTSLPAVLMRKSGMFKFHYYHSVDYSTDRFKNKLLNNIYVKLLKNGIKNADLVGFVSHSAIEILSKFGAKKTMFIPNSMDFHSLDKYRKPLDKRNKYSLVLTCSEVSHKYLVKELVELVNKLKTDFPTITFNVLGRITSDDPYYSNLLKYVKDNNLSENVIFHGQVDRETNYNILSSSYIGLAFYDGLHSHVKFGDALKIREYSALGLPTVGDSHTYTAVEMNDSHAGFTVTNFDEAFSRIFEIFNDVTLCQTLVQNALKLGKKYDKKVILEKLYNQYLKSN